MFREIAPSRYGTFFMPGRISTDVSLGRAVRDRDTRYRRILTCYMVCVGYQSATARPRQVHVRWVAGDMCAMVAYHVRIDLWRVDLYLNLFEPEKDVRYIYIYIVHAYGSIVCV